MLLPLSLLVSHRASQLRNHHFNRHHCQVSSHRRSRQRSRRSNRRHSRRCSLSPLLQGCRRSNRSLIQQCSRHLSRHLNPRANRHHSPRHVPHFSPRHLHRRSRLLSLPLVPRGSLQLNPVACHRNSLSLCRPLRRQHNLHLVSLLFFHEL